MKTKLKKFIKKYFEAIALGSGLLLMALMDPVTSTGPGFCILERLEFPYCPGDGLGHSVAYIFRGDIYKGLEANLIGPFAIIIISGRILQILIKNYTKNKK